VQPKKPVPLLLIGAAFSALIITFVIQARAFQWQLPASLEFSVRDLAMQMFASPEIDPNIVVIDINEESLQALGPWPWSRQTLADLSQSLLTEYGAKLVALDIVLPNTRDAGGDQALARLAESGRLVLSQAFDFVTRDTAVTAGSPAGGIQGMQLSHAVIATGFVANHAGLSSAKCVGNIGFMPDLDGKLRRIVDWAQWSGKLYPSLSRAIINCLEIKEGTQSTAKSIKTLRFDRAPEAWIVVPALELLAIQSRSQPSQAIFLRPLIENRIAIIGSSALGLADRVATPLSPNMAGVFVHAQAVSELLRPSQTKSNWLEPLVSVSQLALVGLFAFGVIFLRNLRAVFMLTAAALIAWLASVWFGYILNLENIITAALWGFGFTALCVLPMRWAKERAQARATISVLSRYLSKPVLHEVLDQDEFDPLVPRRANITVLVADMVAYTAITESQTLDKAAFITKRFLEAITEPVWSNRGTLDQYTGDGLIAFWGAPIESAKQADEAVNAALEMLSNLERLNAQLGSEGFPTLQMRIGIAAGEALVGNFGTPYRATYTAVGKCINMASRLQALAKDHPQNPKILISKEVAEKLNKHSAVSLGTTQVRGIGDAYLFTVWQHQNNL
jgi:adenylate cyclase